jgi:hypothetical protein
VPEKVVVVEYSLFHDLRPRVSARMGLWRLIAASEMGQSTVNKTSDSREAICDESEGAASWSFFKTFSGKEMARTHQ